MAVDVTIQTYSPEDIGFQASQLPALARAVYRRRVEIEAFAKSPGTIPAATIKAARDAMDAVVTEVLTLDQIIRQSVERARAKGLKIDTQEQAGLGLIPIAAIIIVSAAAVLAMIGVAVFAVPQWITAYGNVIERLKVADASIAIMRSKAGLPPDPPAPLPGTAASIAAAGGSLLGIALIGAALYLFSQFRKGR